MTSFLNDNQGWWGFLAVPPALAAVLITLWQVRQTSKTNRLDEVERWKALLTCMTRNRSLALRQRRGDFQLPVRLEDRTGRSVTGPADTLAAHLIGGGCAEVIGEAGSGKSYLAVEVRTAALEMKTTVVVDVVSARDWSPRGWTRVFRPDSAERNLADWGSAALHKRYRIFRRSYLRQLIQEGRIILAVDSFDEVDEERTGPLWQAILDHAASLPLLVMRRTSGSISEVTAERLSFYEFARYKVKPLGERAVAAFLRTRFDWYDRLADAKRPDLVRLLLTNPLQLHLAVQVWSRTEAPRDVLDAEDPGRVLWSAFIREKLDRSALGRHDPRLRRVAQVLALSASMSTARLSRSFHDSRIRVFTIVALTLIVLPLGWARGTPVLAVTCLLMIAGSLREQSSPTPLGIDLRRLLPWPGLAQLATALVCPIAYLLLRFLWALGYSLVTMIDYAMTRYDLTLTQAFTDTNAVAVWWQEALERDWTYLLDPVTLVVLATTWSYLYPLLLWSTKNDILTIVPGWNLLPFRRHLWPRALVAGLVLYPFSNVQNGLWIYGTAALATVLYNVIRLVMFAWYVKSPTCTSRTVLRSLDELGIVYHDGGRFRFTHKEIADNIAVEVFRGEDQSKRHVRMITQSRAADIIYSMASHQEARRTGRLVRQLLAQAPPPILLVSIASLVLTYAAPDLAAARRFQRKFPRTEVEAHLAETYWYSGEVDRARAVMAAAVRRSPDSPFMIDMASRMAIALGDVDVGLRILRTARTRLTGSAEWFARTRLAVVESQLDLVPDSQAAGELDLLCHNDNPFYATAILESARRWSECRGDHARAARLLKRLEREGWGEIVSARLAQVHFRLDDHDAAMRYARRTAGELVWDSRPAAQLETAITAEAVTNDPLASRLAARLEAYGWPVDHRLADIRADLRTLRTPAQPT